jgi:hypothetical protein
LRPFLGETAAKRHIAIARDIANKFKLMRSITLLLILTLYPILSVIGQNLPEGQKRWSSEDRLTIDDFKIKVGDENIDPVFSQFLISHAIGGFDFMKQNLNQKIENIFIGNASWIDTTKVDDIQKNIEFQQLQFDLAEIQARKFRKKILEKKGQISKGQTIVDQINNEIIEEFSNNIMQFVKETQGGSNEIKLAEWQEKIANELRELDEYRFENKKKIKLSK